MRLKQIFITLLCFCLLNPTPGFSASNSFSSISFALTQHREIISGAGSFEMVTKHGKALADATFKLLADPKNRAYLNSPEGQELRSHQSKLSNFLAVKDHFEKCVKNKNSKRKIDARILESSFQSMSKIEDTSLPCLPPEALINKSYQDFNNDVMKAMKVMVRPYFQNQLSKQIITNTGKSLLAFKQKFKPHFMHKGYLTQVELNEVLGSLCHKKIPGRGPVRETDICKKMDPSFRAKLAQELIDFSKNQKSEKITPEKATASLNSSIERLNTSLAKITVTKDIGYIYDSADLSNKKTKLDFDKYVNQYMAEVSKDAGALLLTKTMKDEAGSIKSFNTDDTEKNKRAQRFQFTPHKKIKLEDVKSSIKEVEGKILAQAHDTLNVASDATNIKGKITSSQDDINELVKINPFAAGQVLLREPQYAGLMCEAINNINQNDVNDANFDKYFTVGAAVLGGALILTGVGTLAGAYMITGSLTAGVAAGTIGGSILGYSALAGTAMELTNLTYYSKKSYDAYQEMNRQEAAYFTQNTDAIAITDAKNALVEFKDARFSAGFSLANVGLNAFAANSLFNLIKLNPKVSPDQLKIAAKIMRHLSQTATARKLKDVVKVMGDKGMEKIDVFLLHLAHTGESGRVKFLELISNSKITPDKIREVIESSLDAAKNCGKI